MVKRRYEPFPLEAPRALSGHRDDEPFADTDVPGFRRRELLPTTDPAFDFNMSLLAFDPGVGLDKVEIHDEEHGLYMTAGGGTYLLEDRAARGAGRRLHLHGALLPAVVRRRATSPPSTCSTRTSGATVSERAPLNPLSRPLAPRDCAGRYRLHRAQKANPP